MAIACSFAVDLAVLYKAIVRAQLALCGSEVVQVSAGEQALPCTIAPEYTEHVPAPRVIASGQRHLDYFYTKTP